MTDVDLEVADSFERLFPVPAVSAEWDGVLQRAGDAAGTPGSSHAQGRHRRRLVVLAARRSSSPLQALLRSAPCAISCSGNAEAHRDGPAPLPGRPTDGASPSSPSRDAQACNGPRRGQVMNADGSGQRNLTREWGLETTLLCCAGSLPSGLRIGGRSHSYGSEASSTRSRRVPVALLGHLRHEHGRERAPPTDPEPPARRRSRLVARRTQAGVRPGPGRPLRHLRRQCGWKRAAQARSRHHIQADAGARAQASPPILHGRRTVGRSRS